MLPLKLAKQSRKTYGLRKRLKNDRERPCREDIFWVVFRLSYPIPVYAYPYNAGYVRRRIMIGA